MKSRSSRLARVSSPLRIPRLSSDFHRLSTSGFLIVTSFVIDELILDGADPSNTANIGLLARAADSMPASSGGDRYQVSYFSTMTTWGIRPESSISPSTICFSATA